MSSKSFLSRIDPGDARLARMGFLYALCAVPALLLVWLVMSAPSADGLHDRTGATLGHDLSQIWVAGHTALTGHAPEVYSVELHHARQRETFGSDAASFAWHYPPVFLLVAASLAMLPYVAAIYAWAAASLLLLAGVLRAILGRWRPVVVGLAFPTVFECLDYGQNGLLTASLLGFGLLLLDRRPLLAGLCLGLLCYKPQLAIVAPLLMLATGRWRVAAASAAAAVALCTISLFCFGSEAWMAFLSGLRATDTIILKEAWGGLSLNASAFGAARILGASMEVAWGVQILTAALAATATLAIWTRPCPQASRNAVLLAAVPLVSPYVPVYDLALLAPAGAFLVMGARSAGGLVAIERIAIPLLFVLALQPREMTQWSHWPCCFTLGVAAFVLAASAASRRCGTVRPATDGPWASIAVPAA